MVHELWLAKPKHFIRLTPILGELKWRTNVDELGLQLDFNIANNANAKRLIPKNPLKIGDMVILRNKDEITRAIIVDENKAGYSSFGYTAFDAAFYLNKSNAVYQFKGMRADKCIKKITKDFKVPVGKISSMSTKIKHIFNDQPVSDILKEILEMVRKKTKTKYLMEMRAGKFYVEKQGSRKIKTLVDLYGKTYDNTLFVSNPTRTRSIQEMKNAIQIVGDDDKVVYRTEDKKMINKYGKLQSVVTLDQDEKRSAKTIAKNELKELSKITEETSIELLGNNRVRAGRILEVNEPITGLKGDYLIKSAEHTISGGIYTMALDLEAK